MDGISPLDGLWKLLKSKTLAAVMILVLAVTATAGMLKPDAGIFGTRWFALLGLVFITNLTSCTIQQVINAIRLWGKRNSEIKSDNCMDKSASKDIDLSEIIRKEMTIRRFKPVLSKSPVCLWAKGSLGIWGAPVFHIGLILITVGAMVSGSMKMTGHVKIAEGEVRYESHGNYDSIEEGPFFGEGNHKGFGLTLLKQNVTLDPSGEIEDIVSDLGILENGQIVNQVSLSEKEPFIYNGLRIFRKEAGFAPFLEINGPGNAKLLNGFVLLETKSSDGNKAEFYLNDLPVGDSGYSLNIRFFPDMVQNGLTYTTAKYTLSNPGAVVAVYRGKDKITEKAVKPGEILEFAGYSLKIGDIRHWSGFDIVNDRGADFVFAGCWLGILGLVLMYLIPYKKVQLVINDYKTIQLIGITNRNRRPFVEELSEMEAAVRVNTVTETQPPEGKTV